MAFKRVLSVFLILLVLVSTLCAFAPFEVENVANRASSPLPNYSLWLDLTYLSDDASLTIHYDGGTMVFGGATHGNFINIEPYDLDGDPISGGIVFKPLYNSNSGLYYYYIDFDCDMYNSSVKVVDDNTVLQSYSASTSQIEIDYDKSYDIRFVSGTNNINYSTVVMIYFMPNGYNQGYQAGYNAGYSNGQIFGYNEGYELGLDEGYNQGRTDGVEFGLYGLFTDPIGALLNFTILPSNNGLPAITVGGVLLTLISISLVLGFLKYFAGG